MHTEENFNFDYKQLIEQLVLTYENDSGINFIDVKNLPVRDKIIKILESLIEVLFPGYTGKRELTLESVKSVIHELLVVIRRELSEQIERALRHQCRIANCPTCDCPQMAALCSEKLLMALPEIRGKLKADVQAAFEGDPAAKSFEEVVVSYPYIIAITVHRIAHELYLMEIPLIPRIMSEWAHGRTGIDIHPGAQIGNSFFIDHGTGVVIGETARIGNNVKIYQGVTLGALSFPRDASGKIIRGKKRHPTLEDNVTVYAEATLLGDITIGKGAIIGGNVWIRESVPAGAVVTVAKPESMYITRGRKKRLAEGGEKNEPAGA